MATLFISHSSRDGAAIAQPLAAALEAAGHRCWIAPRDVKPGTPYPGQIVAAIRACDGLVLIVTPAANESPDVLQEVQLAGQHRKTIAPIIVGGATPSDDLHYYLGVRHQIPWSDVQATTAQLLRSFPASAIAAPSDSDATSPVNEDQPSFDVFMLGTGARRIDVVKIIREFTGLGLAEAKLLMESTPPVRLLRGVTYLSAHACISQLRAIGAQMLDPVKLG